MKIFINEQIINRFKEDKISIDYIGTIIIILTCLYEGNISFLDTLDDNSKAKRLLTLYRYLYRKELITEAEDDETEYYVLTPRGEELVMFINSFDDDQNEVYKENFKEVLDTEQKLEEWIVSWLDLFPTGKHFGRYLRTNKNDCLLRMKWFISNNDYSKDIIFKATKLYLESQEESPNGHQYTRNSSYFINKGRGNSDRTSELATWCERVTNEGYTEREHIERDLA